MANYEFLGSAPDRAQVSTVTAGGTFAGSETLDIEIGGAKLSVDLGSDTGTDDVVEILARLINGDDPKNDEVRNSLTGDKLGQWASITATYSGSVLTLTADQDSRTYDSEPFTFASDDSGSTSGTLTDATPTSHQGPYDFNTAENWSGGVVPGAADTAILRLPGKHLRWGIESMDTVSVHHYATWDGDWGLPPVNNRVPHLPYEEYRPQQAQQGDVLKINIGEGPGSSLINVDMQGLTSSDVVIEGSGERRDENIPAIQLSGLLAGQTISVSNGADVGIDTHPDATTSGQCTVNVTGPSSRLTTEAALGTVSVSQARALINGSCATLNCYKQARVTVGQNGSTTVLGLYDKGTVCEYNGATLSSASVNLAGGTFDLSNNATDFDFSSSGFEVYAAGSRIIDPLKQLGTSFQVDLNEIGIEDMDELNLGKGRRLTVTNA